jgi:hypothetical protein
MYRGRVTDSPLSASELRAAAETHHELAPEYRDGVLESFVERVSREIDARVDARLAQAASSAPARSAPAQVPARAHGPKTGASLALALGSMALGIPITAILAAAGTHPVGLTGVVVVWLAIAIINIAFAVANRPPADSH